MEHLPGIINPSNDLTKPLGWVLHHRHARRSMGHFWIGSPDSTSNAPTLLIPHTRVGGIEAGEGVGAQSMGTDASHESAMTRESESGPTDLWVPIKVLAPKG